MPNYVIQKPFFFLKKKSHSYHKKTDWIMLSGVQREVKRLQGRRNSVSKIIGPLCLDALCSARFLGGQQNNFSLADLSSKGRRPNDICLARSTRGFDRSSVQRRALKVVQELLHSFAITSWSHKSVSTINWRSRAKDLMRDE